MSKDKYAHNPLLESNNRVLSSEADLISRNLNEKMNKRATYLTINPPRTDHSRHMDLLGSGPCSRGTCNTDRATRLLTHAHSHVIFAIRLLTLALLLECPWIM
ncbi:hypothetical protein FGIG_02740 [Fasciola gigantica]|uniref:Uncharacterized protein n=1 Tax=Fasciola gigantica TaxID=46835 RepID=A0A504Z4L4_FASGI|nr:hypothetical protein FGIG_02740 [Fasciola gigantica]